MPTAIAATTAPTLPATLPAAPVYVGGLVVVYVIGCPVPAAAPAVEPAPAVPTGKLLLLTAVEPAPAVPTGKLLLLLTAVNSPLVEQEVEDEAEGRVIIFGVAVLMVRAGENRMVEL